MIQICKCFTVIGNLLDEIILFIDERFGLLD